MSLLRIHNLKSGYGSSEVVRGISLDLDKGTVLAISGRNGVGKSTLLKTIIGLVKATEGEIYFDENQITNLDPSVRSRMGIGYVPQGREIYNTLTVEENILLPIVSRSQKVNYDDLKKIYETFPILLEKQNDPGGSLSGGQQQQLAIARALIFNPKVVLLDEPSEGIQPSIVSFIAEKIQEIQNYYETSFIIVEQNISFISQLNCNCIIIDKGKKSSKLRSEDFKDLDKAKKALSLVNN